MKCCWNFVHDKNSQTKWAHLTRCQLGIDNRPVGICFQLEVLAGFICNVVLVATSSEHGAIFIQIGKKLGCSKFKVRVLGLKKNDLGNFYCFERVRRNLEGSLYNDFLSECWPLGCVGLAQDLGGTLGIQATPDSTETKLGIEPHKSYDVCPTARWQHGPGRHKEIEKCVQLLVTNSPRLQLTM